ncbi:hypothetical protein GH714_015057 [Hevea brasiliensis]|uniref:Retropepsins domain-containing protein n=1 Tax=Hevea brasiliensis TaxID=3981 RepID=A0A6A6NH95_HEVBR|nr:hypothetical protein GH714_015057 [Hevea brasiliensis]
MGSLQLSALKVQEKGTVNVEKGRPFVQIEVGGQKLRALLDTGASHNFLTVRKLRDFFVVSMDDSPCILGVEFVDRAKAIPMLFANSMCITEGGGTCVVPLLRGKRPTPLQLCMLRCMILHQLQGEKQQGKGGGTPKKDLKECKRGHTPKLQKGHPPREKVDCARGNAVARSPKEESSPRQEGPRRHRSRKSGGSAKPREELVHLATGTREVLQEHSKRKPEATLRCMPGGMGGEGGSVGVNPCGAKGRCIAGRQCLRESIFGANRPTGEQESCREVQAKMRLSLPTARQNEVQRCWRRAGRLLGQAGRWEAQNEVHGPSLAHNGPAGVRAAWEQRAGRQGAKRGSSRWNGARKC